MGLAPAQTRSLKESSSSYNVAPERPYVMASKEEIKRKIANLMWISDTKVRMQMQTDVAAESGTDDSYARIPVIPLPVL